MDGLASTDPFTLFDAWFDEAKRSEPNDPNAMALATATKDGMPSVRIVLLKGIDPRGFVFYTNFESRKGGELTSNSRASLCFHWKSLHRQIRIEGGVEVVGDDEADAYYATRPRDSRIAAWASAQSRPLESRDVLKLRVAELTEKFADGEIPRPPFWSGFRVVPQRIEFWQDQPFRLHDRLVYTRSESGWTTGRLFP
ncbi:MAG TPA: pyridoxamine 5'-phosphate oxidase [Stellaceae bacterium]|nr:pyridoxamine 5'-phosphate oxidase [Stellaceae bacterium]